VYPSKQQRDPVQTGIRMQIEAVALQKLWLWTEMAKGEVSALGIVEEIRDVSSRAVTALLVTDFFLVKQNCSADETTMDPASVAALMLDLEAKGLASCKLRCWAHSHGDMSVFWSATDNDCVAGLANGEWLLSLVVNKKRDTMMRLDQFNPTHLYLTDVVWEVFYPRIDGLAESCAAEFKAKVQETSYRSLLTENSLPQSIEDLKQAHERGTLTDDELDEELWWNNLEKDDLELAQPF
jgi:hypothetical protein